jgi:hypothetical protein
MEKPAAASHDFYAEISPHLQRLTQARLARLHNPGVLAGHVGVEAETLRTPPASRHSPCPDCGAAFAECMTLVAGEAPDEG